jgi:hypothetical protein
MEMLEPQQTTISKTSPRQNDEEQELYPIETQILLTPSPPIWLVDPSLDVSTAEMMRFQFMCECLAAKEDMRAKTASENFQELYQNDSHGKCVYNDGVDEATRFEKNRLSSFIPLQEYWSSDDTENQHSSLSVETEVFPSAYTQQLLAIPKPHIVQERPKSAAAVIARQTPPADIRFRDKLWSKERVLLWCSNFQDTAPEHALAPRPPAVERPFSARERAVHRHAHNATIAVESRLNMVTLSTTAKTLGKFRSDAIAAPAVAPPTIRRDEFLAAQAHIKHMDVKQTMKKKQLRDEKRAQNRKKELASKQQCVKQVQASKFDAAVKFSAWQAEKSTKAKNQVDGSLNAAKIAAAGQNEKNEEQRSKQVRQAKFDKKSAKIGSQIRKKSLDARSVLNTIAKQTSKKAYKREAKYANEQKKRKVFSQNIIQSSPECEGGGGNGDEEEARCATSRGMDATASALYGTMKNMEKSGKRQQCANSIKDLLLARYHATSPAAPKQKQTPKKNISAAYSDDDHSLFLSSQVENMALEEDVLFNM